MEHIFTGKWNISGGCGYQAIVCRLMHTKAFPEPCFTIQRKKLLPQKCGGSFFDGKFFIPSA